MHENAMDRRPSGAEPRGAPSDMGTARSMHLTRPGWTPSLVAERLAEAADALARLPDQRVRGLYDLWPRLVGEPCGHARAGAAAPEAIDRMDKALSWLMWLEPEERRLVWLRAQGLPWKWITRRLGIGRTTAWQRWTTALLKIAVHLNVQVEEYLSPGRQ
jgi:DNA-binding CsgD family transcriptional regulator